MEISAILTDANGTLLTGKAASTALKIRRVADGYLLDWEDMTFKADPETLTTAMTEVDATHMAGQYKKAITITAWADGFYQALVHFDDATTILNFSGEVCVQDGQEVELQLDAAVSTRMATFTYTEPDNTNIGLIKTQTDKFVFSVTNQVDANVKSQDNIDFGALQKTSLNAATPASIQNIPATGTSFTALGDTRIANLDVTVSSRAIEALGNVAAIKADIEHATYGLNALLTAIGTRMATFSYTAPDSAATIAAAVWDYLTASMTTLNSIGKKLANWVVGTIDTYTGNTKQTGDAYSLLSTVRGTDSDTLKTLSDQLDAIPTTGDIRIELATELAEITLAKKYIVNRLKINKATGEWIVYADNGTTPLYTGTISDDGAFKDRVPT